jgi:hypothetical protein
MPAALHSLHIRLTVIVGVGLLIQVAILLVIIFTLPFDVANGLVNLIGYVAILVIGAPVALMIRRFNKERRVSREPSTKSVSAAPDSGAGRPRQNHLTGQCALIWPKSGVRTRSASNLASPASDLAPET